MSRSRHRGLLGSAIVVGLYTGGSRILGLVREVLMGFLFGTSLAKSAFDVAFRIPNLFRRLFGEGALSAAFVPVFSESLEKGDMEEANRLASSIMTMMAVVLGVIVLGGILLISAWLRFAVLGEKAAAVLPLLRIMLPYMFFICLVALCMAILNSFHHFAVPAATPVILNVVWIAALLVLCPRFGDTAARRVYGAAWGIIIAGVVQLAVQVPVLIRYGIRPRPSFDWRGEKVGQVLAMMAPVAVGMGVHQINVVIDGFLALWAAPWAPAALTYAERLIYLPLGLFATALGTVLLPTYSRQAARAQPDEIRATVGQAMGMLMLVMIPASLGLMALSYPIVELVFQWGAGKFDASSTLQTARGLFFYAPGLIVFSFYKVVAPAFYALKDARTPLWVGVGTVVLNLVLNVTFVVTLPVEYKHAGLAFATVLASAANGGVLAWMLNRRIGSPGWPAIGRAALGLLGAGCLMVVAVLAAHRGLLQLAEGWGIDGKPVHFFAVGGSIAAGLFVYALAAALIRRDDVKRLLAALRHRKAARKQA